MTAITYGVGSLFGSGKLKELEQTNTALHEEIAQRDKSIEHLHTKMEHLQEQHSRQLREVTEVHWQELQTKNKEISQLGNVIAKALHWFPMLREMLRMEKFCKLVGFSQELTDRLVTKREAVVCSGKIYSEERKQKFDIKNDTFKVEKDQSDSGKLVLTINRQVISDWFRERFERICQSLREPNQEQRKSRGMRL